MKKLITIFTMLALIIGKVYADSPLTSTDFYRAYLEVPVIKKAADNPHQLTEDEMEFLFDDENPLDVRLAIINAIGFDPDKRLNTIDDYINYSTLNIDKQKYNHPENKIITREDLLTYASPDQLAIYTYLAALADYFNLQNAYYYAEIAMQNPVSK